MIAHQLTGIDDARNMITGTRYLNVDGMIPFEEMVGDYIRETGNHVMHRVTPVYTVYNLLADGIYMEAMSVEDKGKDIQYHVYVYNVQPGVYIDYENGEATIEDEELDTKREYVLNTNSKKVHLPSCDGAKSMNLEIKKKYPQV